MGAPLRRVGWERGGLGCCCGVLWASWPVILILLLGLGPPWGSMVCVLWRSSPCGQVPLKQWGSLSVGSRLVTAPPLPHRGCSLLPSVCDSPSSRSSHPLLCLLVSLILPPGLLGETFPDPQTRSNFPVLSKSPPLLHATGHTFHYVWRFWCDDLMPVSPYSILSIWKAGTVLSLPATLYNYHREGTGGYSQKQRRPPSKGLCEVATTQTGLKSAPGKLENRTVRGVAQGVSAHLWQPSPPVSDTSYCLVLAWLLHIRVSVLTRAPGVGGRDMDDAVTCGPGFL